MFKGVGVPFADFISLFLKFHVNEIIWSRIGYLKTGDGEGVSRELPESPLDPPLQLPLYLL